MSAAERLPPAHRGIAARRLTEGASQGRFELPVCDDCGAVQYPVRERCMNCLSGRLTWKAVAPEGALLARTSIHHSNEPWFRSRLPVGIGSVKLDIGPVAIVMLEGQIAAGQRVRVSAGIDETQQAILAAEII